MAVRRHMVNIQYTIYSFILSFRIDDLCRLSLESEEMFGILILCKFCDYFVGKAFFIKTCI